MLEHRATALQLRAFAEWLALLDWESRQGCRLMSQSYRRSCDVIGRG